MSAQNTQPLNPLLVKGWLTARSIARGLPAPVDDRGGWRVDTGLATETQRYVFAGVTDGLQNLAETISSPLVFLKLCASEAAVRAVLPARWQIVGGSYLMTLEGQAGEQPSLPSGYAMDVSKVGSVVAARIVTEEGALAASGFAAEADGAFVYDRIVTEPAHRRRGLGAAIMKALGSTRRSAEASQVLVATEDGRALYSTLGWIIQSPYTTAVVTSV